MKNWHLGVIAIVLVAYVVGAKYPSFAQKIGVV